MLISKKWLQAYFAQELPTAHEIANTLMVHSFEIEEIFEHENGDWIIDIDVLPNRAHDCLGHAGVAHELAGLLGLELHEDRFSSFSEFSTLDNTIEVDIQNPERCYRYMATLVKGVNVTDSPEWLQNRMGSMGQRSINNLVDATNFVMFDLGQPMHVFDADKVSGKIVIRNAKEGETMTTLSGEEIELLESDLLISDEEKILALAGVKGGNAAEVDQDTKNIIIESANFNPLSTRKTARRVKILTDASKRYENEICSEFSEIATLNMLSLVTEIAYGDGFQIGKISDSYVKKDKDFSVDVELGHVQNLLGFEITQEQVSEIFTKFKYDFSFQNGVFSVSIPSQRLDLRNSVDLIEEIGRLFGYHNIPSKSLDDLVSKPELNRKFYVSELLRNYFIENGFTELMNYTFVDKGDCSVKNPVASDKAYLRNNLSLQMQQSLEKNAKLLDYIGLDQVKLFEIDSVHDADGEKRVCCFAIDPASKKSRKKYGKAEDQIAHHIEKIEELLSSKIDAKIEGSVVSFDLDQISVNAIDYGNIFELSSYGHEHAFVGISPYPYMKRDISFWVSSVNKDQLEKTIRDSGAEFLKKVYLFDEFEKDGKTSFAFSMIFQSAERTLVDVDVDLDMKKITDALSVYDIEVR